MDPFISGRDLAAAIRDGRISSLAATDFYINRIERLDGLTNLVVVRLFDAARERAREADAALLAGRPLWGPLHGVPMTIKENYSIKGVVATCGMEIFTTLGDDGGTYRSDINSGVVQRLLDAGAIFLGKTNLPEQAADYQSYNDVYGTSRNPWNLEHSPGGSSGGSAGAIAAGFSPLEVGSDIGGSIRTPAHFSGVCGHKPTQGVIDKSGWCPPYPFSRYQEDLAVAGPLCRTCDDLELMMDLLAGPEPERAVGGWRLELPPARVKDIRDLRVAVWLDDETCRVDQAYVEEIRRTAESLARAGASVDYDARPVFEESESGAEFFETSLDIYYSVLGPSMALRGVDPRVQSRRLMLKRSWEAFWQSGFDVLLCPVAPSAALKIDESGGIAGMADRRVTVDGEEREYVRGGVSVFCFLSSVFCFLSSVFYVLLTVFLSHFVQYRC